MPQEQPIVIPGATFQGTGLCLDQATRTTGFSLIKKGAIILAGTLELKGKTLYERMEILEEVLINFQNVFQPKGWCLEGGVDFNHRSLDAARGCTVARYTVAKTFFNLFQEEIHEIQNNILKAHIVDAQKLATLKQNGLRNDRRPLKCDVPPAVIEILGIQPEQLIPGGDHADAIALGICWARGL